MRPTTIHLHPGFQIDRVDPRIFGGFLQWDRVVLEQIGDLGDFISLHRYVGNRDADTPDCLALSSAIDRQIEEVDAVCRFVQARRRSGKGAYLCFDDRNSLGPVATAPHPDSAVVVVAVDHWTRPETMFVSSESRQHPDTSSQQPLSPGDPQFVPAAHRLSDYDNEIRFAGASMIVLSIRTSTSRRPRRRSLPGNLATVSRNRNRAPAA